MRTGRQLRWERALANWTCERCGHGNAHRELAPTLTLVGGQLTETPHPGYQPLHFHCTHPDCKCVLAVSP